MTESEPLYLLTASRLRELLAQQYLNGADVLIARNPQHSPQIAAAADASADRVLATLPEIGRTGSGKL